MKGVEGRLCSVGSGGNHWVFPAKMMWEVTGHGTQIPHADGYICTEEKNKSPAARGLPNERMVHIAADPSMYSSFLPDKQKLPKLNQANSKAPIDSHIPELLPEFIPAPSNTGERWHYRMKRIQSRALSHAAVKAVSGSRSPVQGLAHSHRRESLHLREAVGSRAARCGWKESSREATRGGIITEGQQK